jgi:hypothetical protein
MDAEENIRENLLGAELTEIWDSEANHELSRGLKFPLCCRESSLLWSYPVRETETHNADRIPDRLGLPDVLRRAASPLHADYPVSRSGHVVLEVSLNTCNSRLLFSNGQ